MEGVFFMHAAPAALIQTIRRFNRFYKNILGLLNRHLPDSEFSLPEARVLYELNCGSDCTAKELAGELKMDSGYFSRVITGLIRRGLVHRVQSALDGRSYHLNLTELGKETFARLDRLSDQQTRILAEGLSCDRQQRLAEGMRIIEEAFLGKPITKESIIIRSDLRPGDVGYLIYLHGLIYDRECGYGHGFEGYVCKTFYEFFEHYSPEKDRIWFAEDCGRIVGAIAIVGHTAKKAQLRWFILSPEYRGLGLGSRLMGEAMAFVREKGYKDIFLITTQDQQTAIRMYEKAGFQKATENECDMWGKQLTELTFELHL